MFSVGLFFCLASFLAAFSLGRRSLGAGFGAVLAAGYFYGILRANYLEPCTHFMFDAAALGLYLARFPGSRSTRRQSQSLATWFAVLVAWPIVIFCVPIQHPLIQLVGLRAAIFFLPFLLLGARAGEEDLNHLARWLAGLNLIAFGFALLEYWLGLERFFPQNAVTEIIWNSGDVANGSAHRIPSTFASAHAFGGTMVATLPFLITRWQTPRLAPWEKNLFAGAILASSLGVFMCAARQPILILFAVLAVLLLSGRMAPGVRLGLVFLGGVVAFFVACSDRFQRFLTLQDTEYVTRRLHGSVNLNFWQLLFRYPFGAGLGSAVGTSIPHFLAHLIKTQVGLENEFCRIALEQSPLGLALWLGFIAWTVLRRETSPSAAWRPGMNLIRALVAVSWGTAFIGVGIMTSIPGTSILLFEMGMLAQAAPSRRPGGPASSGGPVFSRRMAGEIRRVEKPGGQIVRSG